LNPGDLKIPKENNMAFKLASTNTFAGLDFSKLGTPKTAEEREAEYQAERARERAEHEAKREQFATKTLDLTLTEVSSHFTRNSDRILRLYGTDTQGRPVRAEYFIPDCFDSRGRRFVLRAPGGGCFPSSARLLEGQVREWQQALHVPGPVRRSQVILRA
jgi:hypothetical protein